MTEVTERGRGSETYAAAVPTRDRPEKLARCLTALSAAQEVSPCPVYVCDSSTSEEVRNQVRTVCDRYPFARLSFHDGHNVPAARNACARAVQEQLLINVDDDIQVEPEAIERLLERYRAASGPRVVGGYVAWDGVYKGPVKLRWTGWGRPAGEGEEPDFLVGALFLYPRALPLAVPWYERASASIHGWGGDDRMMGAVWRRMGVQLLAEERARAVHDPEPGHVYGPDDLALHVYVNLFDAVIANPDIPRALAYEFLGLLSGTKAYLPHRSTAARFVRAWIRGHRALFEDRKDLARLVETEIPGDMQGLLH